MFTGPFQHSIIKRALEKKLVEIRFINIRNFGIGKHKTVDDTPYGGGIGMVLKVDVLAGAIEAAKIPGIPNEKVVLLDARGKTYTQKRARDFASDTNHLILIAGHYEGIDERVIEMYVDELISIGDYILTGGEIPAMVITDSVIRLLPKVITEGATLVESFSLFDEENKALLEFPHYTKPRDFKGHLVPDVLLSGDHKKIDAWRKKQAKIYTELLKR